MAKDRGAAGRGRTPGPARAPGKPAFVWRGPEERRGRALAAPARPAAGGVKIMLYDIETFPNLGFTWGTYEQNVLKVVRPRMIASIAWQWYPSHETNILALPDMPGYDPDVWDNRALLRAFAAEMRLADVTVGHNVSAFDDPMVNTDMLRLGLTALPPHRAIDTLQVLRRKFRFNSNKLNDICQELGIGRKVPHPGFSLWEGCMKGDPKAWALFKKYNRHDVDPLLRGLYDYLRPWIPNHPNLSVSDMTRCCPTCRGTSMKPEGHRYTQAGKYQRFICRDCHSWARGVYVKKVLYFRPI